MRRTLAISSFTLFMSFGLLAWGATLETSGQEQTPAAQQPGAEKKPTWKSREEYDAFQAMGKETDPHKRVALASAVLQKYANSDFKDEAYVAQMTAYQQLNDAPKAIDAAHQALQANPDNLAALNYVSFAFPFVFKADDTDKDAKLSRAESEARHGLEVLQKLQKPPNVSDEQFNQQVKALRANFNDALGFVTLQRKDNAAAITSFRAAAEDNPSDFYIFYRLGLSYLLSSPPDYDNAFWNLARSVSLAKAAKAPDEPAIEKYLAQAYANYHGNDQGLSDIITQAAASPTPPAGFKVAPLEKPKPTGNKILDDYNEMVFPLKLGGERAQKAWDALKDQPLQIAGFVNGVEKGSDPGSYIVRIALDKSKAASGYDIELKDATQPKVTDLSQGDAVRFGGKISAYAATPTFVLTLENAKINEEDLAAAAANKPKKGKTPAKTRPRSGTTRRRPHQ